MNPFVFVEDYSIIVSLIATLIIPFILGWGLINLQRNFVSDSLRYLIVITAIFLISILCGAIVLFMNGNTYTDLLLYFNTYLLVPVLPISAYILWLMYSDLSNRVISISDNSELEDHTAKLFKITDRNNQILVEIPVDRIIVFAANDNYVTIHFAQEDGSVHKQMHRISLKKITALLNELEIEFLRVHKSYLINPNCIDKLKGKAQAYRLEMKNILMEIPVSRSFDIESIKM